MSSVSATDALASHSGLWRTIASPHVPSVDELVTDESHECCVALCQFVVNMMADFGSESTVGFIPVNIGSWQSCNARDITPSHWVGLILDIPGQSAYAVDSWPLTTYDLEVALVRRRFTLAASKVLETPLAERAFNVPSQPGDNECGLSLP